MNNQKSLGIIALLISAFLWATASIFVKQLIEDIPPCFLLAARYVLAAVATIIIYAKRLKKIKKDMLIAGFWMGLFLFGQFITFTIGLQYTTTSRSSFLIASYIILLPLAYWIIRRKKPGVNDILVAVVCMIGICFILGGNLDGFQIGDLYCVACAADYAAYIVISAKYSRRYDGGLLNLIQITTTAILATLCSLLVQDYHISITPGQFGGLLYLAIGCSVIPFFLCIFGMKRVSTTTSGVLLSFECVFTSIMGILVLNEKMYWQFAIGGGIVVLAFILSEMPLMRMISKKSIRLRRL
ncbi:DMT family transporter [Eubacterium oxidoreducens]|uniref:Threonine/homoserine efflux transporter RhtA n=1 Tax=Eubacterium oxidoreducens TaxID=1732 RepID=A0A1G6BMU2_EUBOX|nr:DMT family transporter [Eubacterium oxidoreducens]SDB21923.1 Threonine/homoserine efflux transporter RhtA [Eubacterium oxidoreducens]